eukprot:m.504585 g.504585  ORF g.504585 m.504585 type:complete len:347 (-) comp57356_c1_seq1:228-1268(-)
MVVWGIIGSGRVSSDFTAALLHAHSTVAAVAAQDIAKAQQFATTYGIPRAYGSYEELARATDIDIVYIGTIHLCHKQHVLMCLEHGKNVLVEKPMAMNSTDVQELVAVARAKNLFLMEGLWTRFFPAVNQAVEIIRSGQLGEIKAVQADFGILASSNLERRLNTTHGGGALLDIGLYPLYVALLAFGGAAPTAIAATGKLSAGGADMNAAIALQFDKGTAAISYSYEAESPEETTIVGTKGTLRLCTPAHCPTTLILNLKTAKRGVFDRKEFVHALPAMSPPVPLLFPNSEGFFYEIKRVEKCIAGGQTECRELVLQDSVVLHQTMDAIRKQLGVVYATDSPATSQ